MLEDNKSTKIPSEKVFQLYGDQEVKLLLNITNLTEIDQKTIFTSILKDKNLFNNFKFGEIEKRLRTFMDEIRGVSLKPHVLYANIKSTEEENVLSSVSSFDYNKLYFSPLLFPYLLRSNSIYVKGNYSVFNNRFSSPSSFIQEDEMSAGVSYSQKASKKSFFLSKLLFFKNNYELETRFTSSFSEKDIKRQQNSKVFKVILSKSLKERPFIFRENNSFDNIFKFNVQYAHKIINNYVDEYNCSTELISKLPQEDSQHHLKLSSVYNISNFGDKNVAYFKLGSSFIQTLNSSYLKHKLFFRKFFITNPFTYQFNFEMAQVMGLKQTTDSLKIHEKLFVHNFRGIMNPSRKIIVEEGKIYLYLFIISIFIGKTGDSLGNTFYMMISNKVLFNNIPIFNNFSLVDDGISVSPFIHFNLLYTPQLKKSDDSETKPSDYDPLHLSAGFGVSLLTGAVSMEVYYNAYVKKNFDDVGKEFSIKFGLD